MSDMNDTKTITFLKSYGYSDEEAQKLLNGWAGLYFRNFARMYGTKEFSNSSKEIVVVESDLNSQEHKMGGR